MFDSDIMLKKKIMLKKNMFKNVAQHDVRS